MQRTIDIGEKVPKRGNAFSAWLGRFLLWLLGWRVTGAIPNTPKVMVIGAPHTSNMDGVVGGAAILALGLRISIMVKDSLFRWPLGGFWKYLGLIPVDRSHSNGVVGASAQAFAERDALFLGMAPEGTRHNADTWRTGFYHIAVQAQVPIVVCVLDYGKKELRIDLTLTPSGDQEADMKTILACYKGVTPARPERLSRPLRELQ